MSQAVHLSDQLVNDAKRYAGINSRSVPKQIEYWSRIGKIVEENPDLPSAFIKEILLSKQEADDGKLTDFQFG